jgi:NADH:ubiquinone oxidoreductase subunit D
MIFLLKSITKNIRWLQREKLIVFIEGLTGTRFHSAILLIGRLRYNISLFWIDSFIYWLINPIINIKEIHNILTNNNLWRTRLYEIGIITKETCILHGLSGIISRATKIGIDARFTGYEFYNKSSYSLYLSSTGDCPDRYISRFNEIIETNKIIYSSLCLL